MKSEGVFGILQLQRLKSKDLGITSDNRRNWKAHVGPLMQNSSYMLSNLKLRRDKLTEKHFTLVATAQCNGVLHYACQVWNTDQLHVTLKRKLDVAHYKLVRAVIRDYRRMYPRKMLNLIARA